MRKGWLPAWLLVGVGSGQGTRRRFGWVSVYGFEMREVSTCVCVCVVRVCVCVVRACVCVCVREFFFGFFLVRLARLG